MATVNVFNITQIFFPMQQGHYSKKDVTGELLQGTRCKCKRLWFTMAVPISVMQAPAAALRCTVQHEHSFVQMQEVQHADVSALEYFPSRVFRERSQYSDSLRAGLSGDRIPVGARFSAPVQTGPEAHPASYTMGTGSLSRG